MPIPLSAFFGALSAISAFVAAYLWWRASRIVMAQDVATEDQVMLVKLKDRREFDPVVTVLVGSRLNAQAALCAGCAAFMQSAAIALALFGH